MSSRTHRIGDWPFVGDEKDRLLAQDRRRKPRKSPGTTWTRSREQLLSRTFTIAAARSTGNRHDGRVRVIVCGSWWRGQRQTTWIVQAVQHEYWERIAESSRDPSGDTRFGDCCAVTLGCEPSPHPVVASGYTSETACFRSQRLARFYPCLSCSQASHAPYLYQRGSLSSTTCPRETRHTSPLSTPIHQSPSPPVSPPDTCSGAPRLQKTTCNDERTFIPPVKALARAARATGKTQRIERECDATCMSAFPGGSHEQALPRSHGNQYDDNRYAVACSVRRQFKREDIARVRESGSLHSSTAVEDVLRIPGSWDRRGARRDLIWARLPSTQSIITR